MGGSTAVFAMINANFYGPSGYFRHVFGSSKMAIGECAICINLVKKSEVNFLQCGHIYHAHCILEWFEKCNQREVSTTCPYCKQTHSGDPQRLFLIGADDDDDDDDDDTNSVTSETSGTSQPPNPKVSPSTDPKKPAPQRKKVRCVHWPNCKNGKKCLYVHPKKECKDFEEGRCIRRDMCFYLHPQCKQGIKCTNNLCHYSHVIKMLKQDGEAGKTTDAGWCIYKTICRNKDCKKKHPSPCKFDPKCTKKECTFWHPQRNLEEYNKIKKPTTPTN